MSWPTPTIEDVRAAAERIAPYLRPTALYAYPALDEQLGTQAWVKHENHLPVGAFKVRGGINLVAQLSDEERRRGVICASTGNHGQSLAYAGRLFGVRTIVCVPEGANPVKVASMQGLGAEIVAHGADFDAAREHCEALARRHGYRYVHSGNEPHLVAGVGTLFLEILDERPEIDTIFVPIGGGSAAAAACIVARAVDAGVRVIGVQSSAAPAAHRSWRERRLVEDRMSTYAEGLATRTAFAMPQQIMWQLLDEFVLVDDDEIRRAQALLIETTRNMVEAAGAASLAAALAQRDGLAGRRVALVLSGGNVSPQQLIEIFRSAGAAGAA